MFATIVGSNMIHGHLDDLQKYNQDWTRKYTGQSKLVLRPTSVEEVSAILRVCNEKLLAIVPQGGNTSLVGGATPVFDEIILSLERMDKIVSHNPVSGIVCLQAGVVLETAEDFLRDHRFMMPVDLGAKGSCMIGGNLATNAGGLRLLRYGSLHGNVLGMQVVLADGQILSNLNTNRKDNTGYDLKQLFIGSEGTLGVITAATILTPPLPTSTLLMLLSTKTYADIVSVFKVARQELGEILSAFEFWDAGSQQLLRRHCNIPMPFLTDSAFSILIETSGSNSIHDQDKAMKFLEVLLQSGVATDGTLAQDAAQIRSLWSLRESIPEACAREGIVYKYDISLPSDQMYSVVEEVRQRLPQLSSVKELIGFGHFGDGNLHLNIATSQYDPVVFDTIDSFIFDYIHKRGGSISAEHGIGLMKPVYLHLAKSPEEIALMRQIKNLLDPNGILNPYKVLP